MGDGLLAEFPSVVEAVQCALEIQQSMNERESDLPDERRIRLRIGINLGDIIVEGSDIYGDGVNVAARLEGLADPRGICISGNVYEEIRSRLDVKFEDLGDQEVKNIDRPVRVWRWLSEASRPSKAALVSSSNPILPDKQSIAVLPFTNMSGDPEQEYFADGITEDIIIDLTKLPNLRVAARNSSFAYKNAKMTVQQIASELCASFVLSGSVRKSGDSVRITAQLVNGHTDEHVWAERYDRKLSGIFELQSEIATNIVQSLTGSFSGQEEPATKKYATKNTEAYENYLRARSLIREMTRRSADLAMEMFKKSVALDPDYALAFCGLSDGAGTLAWHYDNTRTHGEDAMEYALKALEIDPDLAEAHACYGKALEYSNDEAGAEREYRMAIMLAPKSPHAYFDLASMYLINSDAERALPFMLKAYELTDQDLQAAMMLSATYRALGNNEALINIARETVDLSEKRLKLNPEDERAAYVGAMALFDLGEVKRARQWTDLAAAVSVEDSRASYNLACAYGLLGEIDEALAHLDKTLSLGCSARKKKWMRVVDADLELVRADPRFAELLARYG
jgi:adenylate cyclase